MPPSGASSAAILRAAMDSGFDPVRLAGLRSSRRTELENQLTGDVGAGDDTDAARRGLQLGDLSSDMATDPYTGVAAHRNVDSIDSALSSAALGERPEIQQASETAARRNAFAEFMKQKTKYDVEGTPGAQDVLDKASQRKIQENEAGSGAKLAAALTLKAAGGDKIPAMAERQVASLHQQYSLAQDVLPLVSKLATAQDEFNTSLYGRLGSTLTRIPGIAGAAESAWQNLLYKHGLAGDDVANALQHIGLAQAAGMTSFAGRPTAQWISLLSQHQAVPGLPWREEERRLSSLVGDANGMPAMLPEMEQGIYAAHTGQRLPAGRSSNVIADPNWGAR